MSTAKKVSQLSFKMDDRVGLLAEITTALSEEGINITAICAYETDRQAEFMLITDDNAKAKTVLSQTGLSVDEKTVVAIDMPDIPGELKKVAQKISSANINISYMYGTAGDGSAASVIFDTTDNDTLVKIINT